MGNASAFEQLPSPLRTLNEDNMVVLLQYLDVSDFMHLTQTCRKFFNDTLGPNNYFWAQILNNTSEHMFVNQLLKTTRNGRKFLVDGKPLDLNLPFDTINKHLVNHFDFKKEIKTYYLQVKCAQSLIKQLNAIASGTNAKISVSVLDETFFVSLRVNARSLETLKNEKLPVEFRSRRVVYQSSKLPAELIFIKRIISRATPPKEIHTITMPFRSLPMHRISPQSPAQPKIARIPKPRPTGSTMEPNKLPTKPKFTSISEPMRILDSSSLPMEFTVEE